MNPKRRRLLMWIVVVVGAGIVLWHTLLTHRSTVRSPSPDARYVTTVRSAFPPFGGYHYNIEVRGSNGVVVRHLIVHDKLVGWDHAPSITWTADSRTVTVGLEDGDTDGGSRVALKRVSIDVQ